MSTADRQRVDDAARILGPQAERDVPLGPMTTYRVGGSAALFARPASLDDLRAVTRACDATGLPILVVGRGSNLLVADVGFVGIAVSLSLLGTGIEIGSDPTVDEPADHDPADHEPAVPVLVRAGGAVALPVLARRTVAASLTGFEWAVGVPGTVGGGVRMNAGGHGSDMAASLVDVELFDLRRGERVTLPAAALGLRFRGSDIADHQVVLSARLGLTHGDRDRAEVELDEVVRWRREHQPGGQNAGSVFVNPVPGEVTAGALVDEVGLRGMRIGTAHVSEKHANFIQADEGGSATDVRAVIEHVRAVVAERTGHLMRSEVRLVGFPDVPPDDHRGVTW